MKTIYNLIKERVHSSPIIINSVLSKAHPWKRSHYIMLSEIIKEHLYNKEELQNERRFELGTSISHMTLQRFFESAYDYKKHNDLRFLKTLDKICIFLDYKSLNDFVQKVKEENLFHESHFTKELATDIIFKFNHYSFEFYKQLPKVKIEIFKDLIFSNAPFLERIRNFGALLSEDSISLVTKNNRSNYEVFDVEILSEEEDKIVLKIQEFWNLLFVGRKIDEEYVVNELSTQVYFIKRIDGKWKIWDNYNPMSGFLKDKIKKSCH